MNRLSSAFAESRLVGSIAAVMLAAAASGTHAAPLETLTIAVNTGFTTMDPWDATDNLSRTAARSFYESLYTFDKNLKPTPSSQNRSTSVRTGAFIPLSSGRA